MLIEPRVSTSDIYLVRHGKDRRAIRNGQVELNGMRNTPLTQTGRKQIEATARWLAKHATPVTAVFYSTLMRADDSARIIYPHVTPSREPIDLWDLRERYGGLAEGKTADEREELLIERRGKNLPLGLEEDWDIYLLPRVWEVLTDMRSIHSSMIEDGAPRGSMIGVTHKGVIMTAMRLWNEESVENASKKPLPDAPVPHGGVVIFRQGVEPQLCFTPNVADGVNK